MSFDVDIAIVAAFLLINLAVGLYHGCHIKNITVYALGVRNFSTATLSATIIATLFIDCLNYFLSINLYTSPSLRLPIRGIRSSWFSIL